MAAIETQGFVGLDDLAAVGDLAARGRAQMWTWEWIARFGRGKGAGWTPDLTGRRLLRWINHALMLLQGADAAQSALYFKALAAQTATATEQISTQIAAMQAETSRASRAADSRVRGVDMVGSVRGGPLAGTLQRIKRASRPFKAKPSPRR